LALLSVTLLLARQLAKLSVTLSLALRLATRSATQLLARQLVESLQLAEPWVYLEENIQ
jgi:hypothetical protein